MNECSAYVGLDVHKDTIAVAVALPGREEPVYRGGSPCTRRLRSDTGARWCSMTRHGGPRRGRSVRRGEACPNDSIGEASGDR